MGKWVEWTEDEKDRALSMYKNKCLYKDIAIAVNKTFNAVNGLIKNYNNKMRRLTNENWVTGMRLDDAVEKQRRECHEQGLDDAKSAVVCGVTKTCYSGWRLARGLESNGTYKRGTGNSKDGKEVVEIKRNVPFKAKDIVHYKHNKNTLTATNAYQPSDVKVTINKELAEQEFNRLGIQRKMALKDGQLIASKNGIVVRGSKWDEADSPKYNTTIAKQESYASSVKRLLANG